MNTRRNFLRSLSFILPLATAAPPIPSSNASPQGPCSVGFAICASCGYQLLQDSTNGLPPYSSECGNPRCKFFGKKYRVPLVPMEPIE